MSFGIINPYRRFLRAPESLNAYVMDNYTHDDICTICLEVLNNGDLVIGHPENGEKHPFHKKCILNWLRSHRDCPSCRKAINTYSLFSMSERIKSAAKTLPVAGLLAAISMAQSMTFVHFMHAGVHVDEEASWLEGMNKHSYALISSVFLTCSAEYLLNFTKRVTGTNDEVYMAARLGGVCQIFYQITQQALSLPSSS